MHYYSCSNEQNYTEYGISIPTNGSDKIDSPAFTENSYIMVAGSSLASNTIKIRESNLYRKLAREILRYIPLIY